MQTSGANLCGAEENSKEQRTDFPCRVFHQIVAMCMGLRWICFFRVAFFIFSFSSVLAEVLENCRQGKFGDKCLSVCLCSKEGTAKCTSDTGECICVKGYTGKLCDHDIDECDNLDPPCARAQMYCSNTRGSYECVCRDGYVLSRLGYCTPCPPYTRGNNCTDLCSCTIEKTVYCEGGVCVCKPGWGGPSCATSSDDCAGGFCPEAAVCVDGHRSYKCICAPGFRLIEGSCQKYETIAAAIEPEPGIGELVDVFVFYRLPEVYSYKSSGLPNFLYTIMIEKNQQSLCKISYNHTYLVLNGSEWFLQKLRNINPQQYGFYSHVKIIFTEAIKSVVHLVPESDEYYEMILEFDASPKSYAQIECLPGMRISGTSRTLQYAVVHKRQSYLSFQIEFNQTRECVETPRVEWTFSSLSKQIKQYPKSCMNAEYITQLDINTLIAESGDRQISDHKSMKEILPKSTLPLGYLLICVLAYVHKNREFRASACGYVEIQPTYVIIGKILPDNEDIGWPNRYPLTLTADFEEPDSKTPLKYKWTCFYERLGGRSFDCREFKDLYNDLEYDRRDLEFPAGFIERMYVIVVTVTVYMETQPQITATDLVKIWGEDSADFVYIPNTVTCLQTCEDVISGKQSVTLRSDFPYKEGVILGVDYWWLVKVNDTYISDEEAVKIIPTLRTSVGPTWKGITSTVITSSLMPGKLYSLALLANVWIRKFDYFNPSSGGKRFRYFSRNWYEFLVEPPPSGKGCIISPSQGEAVFTIFTVECKNYVDPVAKLPLAYRLYQLGDTPEMKTLIAYSGTTVLDKITLSTKGGPGVHTIRLCVEVISVKGTTISVRLSVKLTVLDQAQALKRLLGNIKIQSGGQEDARAMKDIATIIATNSTAGFMQKVEARQDILSNVKNLDSDSRENIEQVSQVLSVSVEKHDEILPEGLNDGLKTSSRLAKYLGRVSNDNLNLTKTVAQSQVEAISKLLYLTATTGESIVAVNDTNNTEAMDKNKEQSFTAIQTISRIADVLLNSLTESNESLKMLSEFMSVYVGWNNVSADSSFKVDSEDAGFNLPTIDSGGVENEIIESEFEIFKKNPYGWTTSNVHGNLPVVKVNLIRQQRKHYIKATKERDTFHFSKPADVFLNYNGSGEENYYPILIKVVKQTNRINIIRSSDQSYNIIRASGCVQITVKVSTTSTTVMKISSPDKLNILVKAKYTNSIGYFDSIYDEEMMEMPFFHPNSVNTSRGGIFRDNDLLFMPQLTKQQIKRNHPYYRIKISLKLNQKVDTTTLHRVEIVRNNTEGEDEEPGEFYNVTIQATPHDMSCLHFDEEKADYLSDECTISMFSNLYVMYCRCVVAAAYTGSVIVLPRLINPLEFGLFLQVFKNPLVVSMVIAVWMFYIALTFWGRIRDKQDEIKNSVTILDDNRENQNYVYLICIVTGWSASSATSSNVFISLKGSWYQSDNHVLQDPSRYLFRSGAEDWFVLTTSGDIGELLAVVVWTDFSGAYPNWFLSSVYVQNMETNESWVCAYNNWIGVQQGIERLQAEIPALQEKVYSSQWTLQIVRKGQNDIRNEHLWFGIITKTPYNTFTRVRRLTTALSLLQSLMILNLMFFGIRDKDDPGQFIEVLDQRIHVTSIIIGIQTAFIIFLLGILISMMFTRVPPPPKKITESETKYQFVLDFLERMKIRASALEDDDGSSEDSENSEDDELGSSEHSSNTSGHLSFGGKNSNLSAKPFNVNYSAVRRRESSVDPKLKSRKHVKRNVSQEESSESDHTTSDVKPADKPGKIPDVTTHWLPWWFIYVTWTVLAIYNLFLSFYIMLYGLSLGYEKSVDWALAFFMGFLMNVFLIQPVKVILMVFILVLIFKQKHTLKNQIPVAKLDDGLQLVQERKQFNRKFKSLLPKVTCRVPLNTTEAKNVLDRLALEAAAREMLRDLFLYTIFMFSVLLVAYGHMDVRSQFLQTQYVKHKFLKTPIFLDKEGEGYESLGKLDKVKSTEDMWDYIKTIVAPEMLINKDSISTEYDIFLMGIARLRQVRSKEDSDACKDLPSSLGIWFIDETCSYSSFYISEETKTYDHTWTVLSNISKDIIDDSPYVYRSSKELHGAILIGQHGVYSGGGYVVPFDQDDLGGMEDAITNLYNSDWIDQLTKCIFVEFTLYNAASDQFTNVVIVFEFGNFGLVLPSVLINSARLLNQELQKKLWLQISQGIMAICTVFYIFVEIQHFQKMGLRQYFSNVWRSLEVLTIVLTAAVGISFFLRYYEFVEILKNLQKYGNNRFFNFEPVFLMHEHLQITLAMLGGVIIFKMLKVTAFNPLVMVTFRTFTNAKSGFYGLLLITAIMFLAFAVTGLLVFGTVLRSYRSVGISLFTLLFFIMGESEYESLVEADLFLGRLYFLAVTVVTQFLILNFYCSMLQEGFELTRYMRFQRERDTVKYMLDRIQFYTGCGPKNVKYKKSTKIIK